MSFDLDTMPRQCDHRQYGERYGISSDDYRTLYNLQYPDRFLRAPLNGEKTLVLRINGKRVYKDHPTLGWSLEDDLNSPLEIPMKLIRFHYPVRLQYVIIELEYTTIQGMCRKCHGTGNINDMSLDPVVKNLRRVKNEDKMVQKAMKFVMTSKCPTYPTLTCPLRSYVAKKSYGITGEDIQRDVATALDKMRRIQSVQAQYQNCTPGELLKGILDVAITDSSDPSYIGVGIKLLSHGDQTVSSDFGLDME